MPKGLVDVRDGIALFDLVSHGRGGPGRSSGLSSAQIEQIARTVGRTPDADRAYGSRMDRGRIDGTCPSGDC
jgi:hypothetical protein